MSNDIQELSKQKADTWEKRMKILEPKSTLYEM